MLPWLATGRYITPNELPEELTADPISAPVNIQLKNESHECEMIKRALQEAGNNKTEQPNCWVLIAKRFIIS